MTIHYRGASRDKFVVQPVDPARPHRFVRDDVGRAGACVICASFERNVIHAPDARQHTVDVKPGETV